MSQTVVVFVGPHGALKGRLAAALFNTGAPAGWRATSAGVHPQAEVSVYAASLLADRAEANWLSLDPPQPIPADTRGMRMVAIDCEVDGATSWRLEHPEPDDAMVDELRCRVGLLVAEVADGGG